MFLVQSDNIVTKIENNTLAIPSSPSHYKFDFFRCKTVIKHFIEPKMTQNDPEWPSKCTMKAESTSRDQSSYFLIFMLVF